MERGFFGEENKPIKKTADIGKTEDERYKKFVKFYTVDLSDNKTGYF